MQLKKIALAALATVTVAGAASAQVVGKMEDQIRWRQSAYTTMAWSMARIEANIKGTYNKDQVIEAANVIQAIANSKMGALYQPGSDQGKGWEPTRLRSEFFSKQDEVGQVARPFIVGANEMAKIAASGDAAAIKAQFGKVADTCDGCHEKFKKK